MNVAEIYCIVQCYLALVCQIWATSPGCSYNPPKPASAPGSWKKDAQMGLARAVAKGKPGANCFHDKPSLYRALCMCLHYMWADGENRAHFDTAVTDTRAGLVTGAVDSDDTSQLLAAGAKLFDIYKRADASVRSIIRQIRKVANAVVAKVIGGIKVYTGTDETMLENKAKLKKYVPARARTQRTLPFFFLSSYGYFIASLPVLHRPCGTPVPPLRLCYIVWHTCAPVAPVLHRVTHLCSHCPLTPHHAHCQVRGEIHGRHDCW